MMIGQRHGGGRRQRDALVGRAEQHVRLEPAMRDGLGIEAAQARQRTAALEQTGVEEIGADPPGLEGEFTELEHAFVDGELDELPLVRLQLSGHADSLSP